MPPKRPRRPATVDHRPRVGRQRRARTRTRILATALPVFAQKGPDAPVIDDFIKAAGVARGTFYNHFKTTDELLVATSMRLEDELILSIEAEMGSLTDPVQRLATGVRLWLQRARADPVFCAFIVRNRFRGRLVEKRLTGDIRAAKRDGRFSIPSVAVGRDLVVGVIREAMSRMTDARVPRAYVDDLTRLILRGLGVGHGVTEQLLAMALPTMQRSRLGVATSGSAPTRGPGRAKRVRPRSGSAATE